MMICTIKKIIFLMPMMSLVCAVSINAAPLTDVIFTDIPIDLEVCPRRPLTNIANVKIAGTVSSPGYEFITVKVFRESVLQFPVLTQALVYSANQADFNLSASIKAELANYDFTVAIISNSTEIIIGNATNIVAGDIFLVNGQSNAVASKQGEESSDGNKGQFLRSFGTHNPNPPYVISDLNWHLADGDPGYGPGGIGQWALRMGRLLIDEVGIPVAIINGSRGGQPISYFQRDDSNAEDIETNYGRLLFRARNAGITNHVLAILWYQGETDADDAETHEKGFIELYNDWLADYPELEKVYIHQLRVGCLVSQWNVDLRNRQRLMPDKFPGIEVMSTTGLNAHDGCHYNYTNGYKELGEHIFALVSRDLYNSTNTYNVEPPNIDYIFFNDSGNTNITIVMRNKIDSLIWESGVKDYFRIEDKTVNITGGEIVSNTVILHLDANGFGNSGLTYSGHSGSGPWVLNGKGVGALTFYREPIYSYFGPVNMPENFIVKPLSYSAIQLSWTAEPNVVNYLIKRDGEIITSFTSTNFVDNGLAQGTEYCYQVASVNPDYTSSWSEVKCASTYENAPHLPDSPGTWGLWHMNTDSITNHTEPPTVPWYIHDDDSANPDRDNDLEISSVTNAIVYNSLYFNGSYRFMSANNWNNADVIKIEFDIRPLDFSIEQRLFEITGSLSVRFQPNSGHTYGRIVFWVYNNRIPYSVVSGWKTVANMSNQWNHVVASVLPNGDFTVSLDGVASGLETGLSGIDDTYSGDARCFVGGDRLNNNRFSGYIDEVKISVIPEANLFGMIIFGIFSVRAEKKH